MFFFVLFSVLFLHHLLLRTHSYNLPFGILSYYTIFFLLLLIKFSSSYSSSIFILKIIFLSSLNFVLCLLCVGFLVFLVFILFHTSSSYSFFFYFFFFIFVGYFFLGLCCCCWGLKEIYIYINFCACCFSRQSFTCLLLLILINNIFLIFHLMIFRMKQGIFNREKVFISSFHFGPILSALPFNICRQ